MSRSSSLQSLSVLVDQCLGNLGSLSLLEVGNDRSLEGKLDEIEGEVPDDVPNPDDSDPSTRDTSDVGEAPVSVSGNNRGDQLSDTESTHKRIRRSLGPRRSVRSSDEDKRLRDDGDLEVDNHVSSVVVDVGSCNGVDTESVLEEVGVSHNGEQGNGGSREVETVTDTIGEDLSQVPRVGSLGRQDSVEGQGHDGTIVEDSNDKNHERGEIVLPDKGHDGETDDDSDGNGTSVDGVVSHSLENDSRSVDGVDNGRQSGFSQDDIGGTSSGIGSTLDGDTDVGTRQSGSIVGTVTSHGTQVTETLNSLDNLEFVLGEDTSESIGVHDHLVQVGVLSTGDGSLFQDLGGVHVVTETQSSTSLLGNSELITGNHLDLDTESNGIINGLLGVRSRRVEDGQETDKLETRSGRVLLGTVDILVSDGKSSETSHGKLFDIGFKLVLEFVSLVSGNEVDDDTSHTLGGSLKFASVSVISVGDFSSLVDRVERLKVEELDTFSSFADVTKGTDDTTVNGVLVFGSRSVGGQETDTLDVPLGVALDVFLVNGELVGGKGTGLVGTKNGDTGKFFNGSDSRNDGLVLGELLSTDGKSDRQDGRHGNGDTSDQKHKDVVKTSSVRVSEVGVQDENLEQDEDTNGDETESTNSGEDHLQVTCLVVVLTHKGGGSTEEGVGTGRDNDPLGFTLFTGGAGETLVAVLLTRRQRFTGKSSLVHGDIDGLD